jgi:hypothetical protein
MSHEVNSDPQLNPLNNFKDELNKYPDYLLLSQYAELKGKGLRNQSFEALDKFILLAEKFTETKKRHLVRFICKIKKNYLSRRSSIKFDSYLLLEKVIFPTLKQWIEDEPLNPEPLKLAGLFYWGNDDRQVFLEKAFALNPEDDEIRDELISYGNPSFLEKFLILNPKNYEARKNLISHYINWINFSTHHLISDSAYIGDPNDDLKLCFAIEQHLKNLQDGNDKIRLSGELNECRDLIEDYKEYRKSKTRNSFEEWIHSKYFSHSKKPLYKKIIAFYYKDPRKKSDS